MVIDEDRILQGLIKFGDQTGVYTEPEKTAIAELRSKIEADEEMRMWIKFAQESTLIVAVRACELNVKKCFKIMTKVYQLATKSYPELVFLIDPLNLRPIVNMKLFKMVKRPTDEGPAILVFRIRDWEPNEIATTEHVAVTAGLYVYSIAKRSAEIQRKGLIAIGDARGLHFGHMKTALSMDLMIKGLRFYSCIPPLCKGAIVVNSFSLVESTFNACKWMLPQKIRKLIHITKKGSFHLPDVISPDRLPQEFGGTIPDAEAYVEGIEEDILGDPELFHLMKHIQEEFIAFTNVKRK